MLEAIHIKKIATYDETGIQITNLKKINFIYGANGSGKTTVTKLIDKPNDSIFTECSLSWRGGIPMKALVYNKDFREANFGKGKIEGVFTLGQATKEEIEAIAKMQLQLSELKVKGIKKRDSLTALTIQRLEYEDEYRDSAWTDIYKVYETEFKEAFVGVMKKESFKARIINEFTNNKAALKTFEYLKETAETIFGVRPTSMNLIPTIDTTRIIEIEIDAVWQKKIIGKADVEIAKLIQKLNLNDWVNEGRNYLQDNETCPFCQQPTITEVFKKQLEAYFDESFTTNTNIIKTLSTEYNRIATNILHILSGIESAEKANSNTKLDIELFSAYLRTLSSEFISNKELLNNKMKEPSRSIDLVSIKEQLENIQKLITEANQAISAHNLIVSNYTSERANLIKEIWKYLVEENKTKIEAYKKKSNGFQ
ncbi:MAG TPA: AAA family ATPase, partial [Flavisolibacter sp.]